MSDFGGLRAQIVIGASRRGRALGNGRILYHVAVTPPFEGDDADDSKRRALKRSLVEATRAFVIAKGPG